MENHTEKTPSAHDDTDFGKNLPSSKFSSAILKSIVGDERANNVLTSMSMNLIPQTKGDSLDNIGNFKSSYAASKSTNDLGNIFKS